VIRAVMTGKNLYARDFAPARSSQEFSGQWRQEKNYMPGMLLEVIKKATVPKAR